MKTTYALPLIGVAVVTLGAVVVETLRRRPLPALSLPTPPSPFKGDSESGLPDRLRALGL